MQIYTYHCHKSRSNKWKGHVKKGFSYQTVLCVFSISLYAVEMDLSYTIKWSNTLRENGCLIPTGSRWNMVDHFDFNGDGFGDFVVSSSYAGEFCNGVYHYEAENNDSTGLKWAYTFYDPSYPHYVYSSVAVGDINGDRPQEKIIAQPTAITHQAYVVFCKRVGRHGVEGLLVVDPEGVVLQESGEGPYMQTALIDFEIVRYIREKGTSRVPTPLKDFRKNKQFFSVYKDKD